MDKKTWIEREALGEIIKHPKEPEITLVTGARQVGKTVLLGMLKDWLIKRKKIPPENILSLSPRMCPFL